LEEFWVEDSEAAAAALLELLQNDAALWPSEDREAPGDGAGTAREEGSAESAAGWLLFEAVREATESLAAAAWALRGDGSAAACAQV
jgi:hypothetical protein